MSSAPITQLESESFELAVARPRRRSLGPRVWTTVHVACDATMAFAGTLAADYGSRRAGVHPLGGWWVLIFVTLFLALIAGRSWSR